MGDQADIIFQDIFDPYWDGYERELEDPTDLPIFDDRFGSLEYDMLLSESEKSWLLKIGKREEYFPKSRCVLHSEQKTIRVPGWLLQRKGLEAK